MSRIGYARVSSTGQSLEVQLGKLNQANCERTYQEKRSGRKIWLATAADRNIAEDVANHIRIFDGVLASDGNTNLKGRRKLKAIQEAAGGSVLPTNVLTDIVRHYSSETRNLVPRFLSESFDKLKDHRKKISGSLLEQMANPLDPKKAMNSLEAWRDAQTDIVSSVMSAWLPKTENPENKNVDATEPADQPETDRDTGIQDELEMLKQQMADMQSKIETLTTK